MQKQAFYKQVHVWSGKVLATVHRAEECLITGKGCDTNHNTTNSRSGVFG